MKLGRRILAAVLAVVLAVALLPAVPVAAAESVEDYITRQFDDFAATLKPEGTYATAMRLVAHSIKGGGKMTMGQNDPFTAALMRTELVRASFIHAATVAVEQMLAAQEDKLFMRGDFQWYEHNYSYTNRAYYDNENGDESDDISRSSLTANQKPYTGSVNGYDEAMLLVIGSASVRYTFEQISTTDDTVTIRAKIKVIDSFDFTGGSYSGNDRDLENFLNWIGKILSLGLLIPFDWTASAELTLEVPNPCTHESASYRWDFDGAQELVNTVEGEFLANALEKQAGTCEDGVFQGTYYTTARPVRLNHDRPWSLEIRCAGTGMFAFSEQKHTSSGEIYLRKAANTVFFGQYVFLNEGDEKRTLTHYGVYFTKQAKISSADWHTYLLTNEVYEDGSNMIYLYIDGISFGPMNQYYHVGTSQNATVDWVSGRDFVFQYVGNGSIPISDLSVESITVWENGVDQAAFSYCTDRVVQPSCTESGYTEHTCTLCGAVFRDTEVPAAGHSFGAWTVSREPTTQEPGERTRSCQVCGHTEREALPWVDVAPGDATHDGKVNGLDLILLRQYLAGWDVTADACGADCNGDGKVNGLDLILLRQYLAGWDVKLG